MGLASHARVRSAALRPARVQCPLTLRSSHIARFKQTNYVEGQTIVRIPLEHKELLGLTAGTTKDSDVNNVCEQLLASPLEASYSEAARSARDNTIEYVRRDLFSTKGRTRGFAELLLPFDMVTGALALMVDVGQNQKAVEVGKELLQAPDVQLPASVRRDVLLSMALANCGLAGEAHNHNQSEQAIKYLQAALSHLDAAQPPLDPNLATDIRKFLQQLTFQVALGQLSGPLDVGKSDVRKRALRTVRDTLKAQGAATAPQQSAPETPSLLGLPPLGPLGPLGLGGVPLRSAVGAGVSGTAGAAGVSSAGVVSSETMEQLMDVLACEEAVHLLEWEQVARSPSAYKWVYPGLLETVAVAHLVHGFVCRQPAYVKMALSLVQQMPSTPDLCAVEAVCHVLLGSINQAASALKQAERLSGRVTDNRPSAADSRAVAEGTLPASRDAHGFVLAASANSDEEGLLSGLCMFTERWLAQAALPSFRDTSSEQAPPADLVRYFDDTRVETLLTVYDAKSGGQLADTVAEAVESIKTGLRRAAEAGLLMANATADKLEVSTSGNTPERQRLLQLVGGGAAVLAVLAVGLMTPPGQRLLGRGEGAAMALMRQRTPLQTLTVAADEFDINVAKQLVQTWQSAKAWALGAFHTTDQLNVLLAEPMLSGTLDEVATLRRHGAHMRFKLDRMQVLGIKHSSSRAGPVVRISALLVENADLHNDSDGKPVTTCRRTYDAEYTVVQGKDGVWRLTNTAVVERGEEGKGTQK